MSDRLKLRLILDVEYELNDARESDLRYFLHRVADRAMNRGEVTQDTPATVYSWNARIADPEEDV